MAKNDSEFSRVRSFLWPIYRFELNKFVPMLILFFLVSFNYHLLRITKESLIVTAPQSGAEVIPFLKVWAMLPTAIFLTFLYTRLSNRFNREQVFYVIMGGFLLFFAFFILFLYPHRESLYLNNTANFLSEHFPAGLKGFIAIIRYWIYSLFYVMAESWSNIMLSVLLWGFANDVTSVGEAKRFYALFGIGINSSGILAGKFGAYLATKMSFSSSLVIPSFFTYLGAKTPWDETLFIFVGVILICGIVTLFLHRWLHLRIFKNKRHLSPLDSVSSTKQEKPRMSLRKTLKYVAKSKYLLYVAIIVLSYNVVINLTEVLWKSQIREMFPRADSYTAYMSQVTFFTGIVATLSSYFISGNIIRRFGWRFAALATPMITIVTGIGFFYFLFVKHQFISSTHIIFIGISPLALAILFGALQNALSRAAKYTVFDDTKEMSFIPLSAESRLKGKSAIDGIGSRLGKSGSSLILQILLMFFATPIACSPIIAGVLLIVIPIWIYAINVVDKKFQALTTTQALAQEQEEALPSTEAIAKS